MATDERNKRIIGLVKTEEGWDLLLKTKAKNLLEVQEDLITMKNSKIENVSHNRYGNLSFTLGQEEFILIELPESMNIWSDINIQLSRIGLQVVLRLNEGATHFHYELIESESLRPVDLCGGYKFYSLNELIDFMMQ